MAAAIFVLNAVVVVAVGVVHGGGSGFGERTVRIHVDVAVNRRTHFIEAVAVCQN